jgi:hypothetical protein
VLDGTGKKCIGKNVWILIMFIIYWKIFSTNQIPNT